MGLLSGKERGRLWLRIALRLVLTVAGVLLVWKVGVPLLRLFLPFVVALALAWAFNRPIQFFQRKLRLKKRGLLALVFTLLTVAVTGGVVALTVIYLVDQINGFLANWEESWSQVMAVVNGFTGQLEGVLTFLPQGAQDQADTALSTLSGWLSSVAPALLSGAVSQVVDLATGMPTLFVGVFTFGMATYFFCAGYPQLRAGAAAKIPQDIRATLSRTKKVAFGAMWGYLRAQVILSSVVFVILLVGFLIMGQPYAFLLAFVFAVLDLLPVVGSGTVMIPWFVVDMALCNYLHALGLAVTWLTVAAFRQIADPKVVGDQTGLAPVTALAAIYVGLQVGGAYGVILGPVLTLMAVNLYRGGAFDHAIDDLQAAYRDTAAILGGRAPDTTPPADPPSENEAAAPGGEKAPGGEEGERPAQGEEIQKRAVKRSHFRHK